MITACIDYFSKTRIWIVTFSHNILSKPNCCLLFGHVRLHVSKDSCLQNESCYQQYQLSYEISRDIRLHSVNKHRIELETEILHWKSRACNRPTETHTTLRHSRNRSKHFITCFVLEPKDLPCSGLNLL